MESVARGLAGWTSPTPRDAATVCLLREGFAGPEVFVMRRTVSMAFAAGMHVYPGGALEAADAHVPVAGLADPDTLAVRTSSADPRALVVAAARETFEECGVLLALDAEGRPAVVGPELEAERVALVEERLTFSDLLARRGLVVDDGSLVPFAHWVTPEVEDRRFDTRFFVAALPAGQDARHIGGEADRAAWWLPADALSAYDEGRMAMLTPTIAVLRMLLGHADVAAAITAVSRRDVVPLLPAPYVDAAGELRWHLVHDRTREVVRPAAPPAASETDGLPGLRP
jgi:8-oxo-dGTP pyrophosphatase MutT (NUDIX family)